MRSMTDMNKQNNGNEIANSYKRKIKLQGFFFTFNVPYHFE